MICKTAARFSVCVPFGLTMVPFNCGADSSVICGTSGYQVISGALANHKMEEGKTVLLFICKLILTLGF